METLMINLENSECKHIFVEKNENIWDDSHGSKLRTFNYDGFLMFVLIYEIPKSHWYRMENSKFYVVTKHFPPRCAKTRS
jgi:hypothetical protein